MAGADYTTILLIASYLCALYFAGQVCKRLGISAVIGEIITGVLLGPNLADVVPFASVFELAGVFGVTLMIFESGLHVDFNTLRTVGARATVVAFVGTLLPLLTGMGVMWAFAPSLFPIWPIGLSVGVSLAPTSVGMALKMLGEVHQLDAAFGQLIVAAAFVDDILSLVALTVVLEIAYAQIAGDPLSAWSVLKPLVLSTIFVVVGGGLAMPMYHTPQESFVRRSLLGWVGAYPRIIPHVVEAAARVSRGDYRGLLGLPGARSSFDAKLAHEDAVEAEKDAAYHVDAAQDARARARALREMEGLAMDAARNEESRARERVERARKRFVADKYPSVAGGLGAVVVEGDSTDGARGLGSFRDVHSAAAGHESLSRRGSVSNIPGHVHAHVHEREVGLRPEARAKLLCMFAVLLAYGALGDLIGSHLLGAFLAGVSFAFLEDGLELWHAQVKRIVYWLVRLFFGATVAFAVPLDAMLSARSFIFGIALASGPTCAAKLLAGLPAGRADSGVVGAAMLGRGEFAFLVAQTARGTLLNPAPKEFAAAAHTANLQPAPDGGGYCIDGLCTEELVPESTFLSMSTTRRRLATGVGSAGDGSFEAAANWCARCVGGICDSAPVPGARYWRLGADCDSHPSGCSCQPMLSAEAFSIVVWALVIASLLAPLLFGWLLKRRARKQQEAHALPHVGVGAANNGPPQGAPPATAELTQVEVKHVSTSGPFGLMFSRPAARTPSTQSTNSHKSSPPEPA